MGAEILSTEEGKENELEDRGEDHAAEGFLIAPRIDEEIFEGQLLDVRDPDSDIWNEARVLQVQNNRCLVQYLFYGGIDDEWISTSSPRLAPNRTMTYAQAGRNLAVGQRVDVLDVHPARNCWKEGTILEATADRVKVRYYGMGPDDDEYLVRQSSRIAPLGTHTASGSNDESILRRGIRHVSHRIRRGSRRRSGSSEQALYPSETMLQGLSRERKREIRKEDPRMIEYRTALAQKGFVVHIVSGDGNCLFRAVSHQIYGTDAHHAVVRDRCMSYMEAEAAYFEPFVLGNQNDFKRYILCKRQLGVWGDDIEIQAMCELYNRPAEIYAYDRREGCRQLRTFHEGSGSQIPMRLSFYGGGHYDSIIGKDRTIKLLSDPGSFESIRIKHILHRKSRGTNAEVSTSSSSGASSGTNNVSSTLEQDLIDEAIRKSRVQYDEQGNGSMEDILARSLQQAAQHEDQLLQGAIHDSVLSNDATNDDGLALKVSDIAATEQAALDEALEMSRKEYSVDDAIQQSLNDVSSSEAKQVELAMRLSQQEWMPVAGPSSSVAGGEHTGVVPMDDIEEMEDELLRKALEDSIRDR